MVLTNKQEQGLKIAIDRYKNNERFTVISGYAGTGKSTLVKYLIAALNVREDNVCYAAFTGKAAQVLLKKGNKNVSTLHRLLFKSFPKPDGTFYRRKVSSIPYKIVIVDEVSMAPKSLMQILFSFKNVHIICLGDPFQLPPVDANEDNHLLDNPHIFLDEVMRQAQESEIIRVTMDIRQGKPLAYMQGQEVMILPKSELSTGMLQWADQILVATNQTRVNINNQMRELLGRGSTPEDGDKVICLKNYWDIFADNDDPLVNGTIGYLNNSFSSFLQLPYRAFEGKRVGTIQGNVISDSGATYSNLNMDKKLILTGENSLDWKTMYRLKGNPRTAHLVPLEFTYAYAITGHKAQGSEWPNVLVIEERFPFDKTEHARWLYTCATRAEEKLVLVK